MWGASKLLLILMLLSSFAAADYSLSQCNQTLKFYQFSSRPFPEIREYLRTGFIQKVVDDEPVPPTYTSGFLVPTKPEDKQFRKHPIKRLKTIYQGPIRYGTKRKGNERDFKFFNGINAAFEKFTDAYGFRQRLGPISFVLGSLLFMTVTMPLQVRVFNAGEQFVSDAYATGRIFVSWNEWGEATRYDYRQIQARKELNKGGVLSPLSSRQVAYGTALIYRDFMDWLKDPSKPKDYGHTKAILENSFLFSHVQVLKLCKLGIDPQFYSIDPSPMTDQDEEQILRWDEDLYVNYDLVSTWAHAGAPRDLSGFSGAFARRMQTILDDSFAQSLLELRDKDPQHISNLDLQFLIQRDLSDQHDFKVRSFLKIIPFLYDENGKPTNHLNFYSLDNLRNQTLDDVNHHRNMP